MDHLRESDVDKERIALLTMHEDIHFIAQMIQVGSMEERAYASERCHFWLPTWLFTSYKISNRIRHVRDNFAKLYSRRYSAVLSAALKSELADIYHALRCHKKASIGGIGSLRSNLQNAERHLFMATTLNESIKFVSVNTRFLSYFIRGLFIKYKATERQE